MGFFDKMFGKKETAEDATPTRGGDLVSALSLHLRGEREQAGALYRRIAEEQPGDNLAPFFAAAVAAEAGGAAEAAEALRGLSRRIATEGEAVSRAVSNDLAALLKEEYFLGVPGIASIIVSCGDSLKGAGFLQESAVCFEIAAGLTPDNAHLLHKLGDTLHDLRLYDYAESVLGEALKHAPNHWGALYTLAVLLQDLGRYGEAIDHYERAVRLNPDHVNCRNNFGAALMMTNRLDEALAQCRAAEELDPASPFVSINLGNILMLKQEYDGARACFEKALSLDPGLAPAHAGLASTEQLLGGDSERIRELYQKALELNPAFPQVHHALGNLLAGAGNPEALAHFEAAVRLNGSLRHLQRDFGVACLQLGREEEGREHLRTALLQDPDDGVAKAALSRLESR